MQTNQWVGRQPLTDYIWADHDLTGKGNGVGPTAKLTKIFQVVDHMGADNKGPSDDRASPDSLCPDIRITLKSTFSNTDWRLGACEKALLSYNTDNSDIQQIRGA
ncbi:hypothetical protein A2U01_0007058, partial [Trifolium medium]|nr:hypothetical protein [Trifolium medium]